MAKYVRKLIGRHIPFHARAGWADRGRDTMNQQKKRFRAAYDVGKQAYKEAIRRKSA